jgi:hypothetical protein
LKVYRNTGDLVAGKFAAKDSRFVRFEAAELNASLTAAL